MTKIRQHFRQHDIFVPVLNESILESEPHGITLMGVLQILSRYMLCLSKASADICDNI